MELYDVIIIGGGPAGLNAAVVLGRCRRNVLLFDHKKQRNRFSHGMHNYLTRDDIHPTEFLRIAATEIKKYGVKVYHVEVKEAKKLSKKVFEVRNADGKKYHSKKLVLATGLSDKLPKIEGIEKFYGKSLFHCPYCDGWEVSDKELAVYSRTKNGIDLALALTTWSNRIILFTDGKKFMRKNYEDQLGEKKIRVVQEKIDCVTGKNGMMEFIVLKNGEKYKCDAMFFSNGYDVQCDLVESLGCRMGKNNLAITNRSQQTNVEGLYVVGDAARDMQFVVVAAAEGAKAGVYINKELLKEEKKLSLKKSKTP